MFPRVGKMTAAQYEDFRRQYPFKVPFKPNGKEFATNFEVRWARAFYAKRGTKCVINKNTAYFQNDREAVLFKMGFWMSPEAMRTLANEKI